jgi:hypothetical protein
VREEDSARVILAEARERTDELLQAWAERIKGMVPGRTGEALAYAMNTPGKRVRAALVLAAYRSVGGFSPAIAAVAAAVETVHTYSLVHDDLPCMDDDDLRRGRPTTHRAFDVPTATRVGLLMVPVAAWCSPRRRRISACLPRPPAGWRVSCSRRAGSAGWSAASGSTSKPKARPSIWKG